MTLLSVIQNSFVLCGLNSTPSVAYTSTDDNVKQMLRLLYVEGRYLLDTHDWQELQTATTFVCGAAQAQTNQPPADFHRMSRGVDMWNDTSEWPITGPMTPEEWTELQVRDVAVLPQYWRLLNSSLYIYAPNSGDTIRYEYVSNKWIKQAGTTAATTLAGDTDTFYFPENVLELGITWRWKKAKGLDYAEDMNDWQYALENAKLNSVGGRRIISTTGEPYRRDKRTWHGTVTG